MLAYLFKCLSILQANLRVDYQLNCFMFHCSGGPGPNVFDALTPLVNWVETGTAPQTITATKFVNDTPPAIEMTRPLCVYPKVAKYNGGSTSIASNFTCVTDEPDFNQTPAPKFGP